jgi:hypothetical protein
VSRISAYLYGQQLMVPSSYSMSEIKSLCARNYVVMTADSRYKQNWASAYEVRKKWPLNVFALRNPMPLDCLRQINAWLLIKKNRWWRMFVPLAPAAKKLGMGLRRFCRGWCLAACLGRWRALPRRAARREYRSLNHHVGFKSFRKTSNFRGLGCSRKAVAHHHHQSPVTRTHNFTFSPAAVYAGSPL